eukprot:m.1563499 g.1563499  ORF g.1563499 m.1563499 type:complete len:752 (+) comp25282_c0_seq31:1253-3508(+)
MAEVPLPLCVAAAMNAAVRCLLGFTFSTDNREPKVSTEARSYPPRDVIGYSGCPPHARWPNGALVALNFVINVEEGSEPSIPDGDEASCAALCECPSDAPPGVRDLSAEGMFAYGARCGIWRVLRAFQSRGLSATIFACAEALDKNETLAAAIQESGFDVCCHGLRWEDHIDMDEETERQRIAAAMKSLERTLGKKSVGWYCKTAPSTNTRKLLVQHGGLLYDSDAYDDDLPYWVDVPELSKPSVIHKHLVVPYTLCTNDSKFAPGRAFSTSEDFFVFMRDALDVLVDEAQATNRPKMMSVGLHPRLIGHPARLRGLQRVLDYVRETLGDRVWVARREDIARHWAREHPPAAPAVTSSPSEARPVTAAPRLLITGGAGFVLSHVVREFLEQNGVGATAVVFDQERAWDAVVQQFLSKALESGRLKLFHGDVSSQESWARLLETHGCDFTHIVAGAALTPTPTEDLKLGAKILNVNFMGVVATLTWAQSHCRQLHRLVHISSDAVLGVPGLIVDRPEGSPAPAEEVGSRALPALSLYALAKVGGEGATRRWRDVCGMDAVSVRFSDVYGPLDRNTGARNRHNAPYWVCRKALRMIREGKPKDAADKFHIAGKSIHEVCWDIIDAPSAARGVVALLMAEHKPRKVMYHLALGMTPTHAEVLDAALRGGKHPECDAALDVYSHTDDLVTFADTTQNETSAAVVGAVDLATLPGDHWLHRAPMPISDMQTEFGWTPTPLRTAIRDYVQHLATHPC